MFRRFNQRQRSIFAILIILVPRKASSFAQLCKFCIPFGVIADGKMYTTLKSLFIKGAFLSSIVKSHTVRFDRDMPSELMRFENLTLVLSLYQNDSLFEIVSY
nr:MAG: hypothetical protein EDM05_27810 [Leptolyngbya sp. IPPAS B-1204]